MIDCWGKKKGLKHHNYDVLFANISHFISCKFEHMLRFGSPDDLIQNVDNFSGICNDVIGIIISRAVQK